MTEQETKKLKKEKRIILEYIHLHMQECHTLKFELEKAQDMLKICLPEKKEEYRIKSEKLKYELYKASLYTSRLQEKHWDMYTNLSDYEKKKYGESC